MRICILALWLLCCPLLLAAQQQYKVSLGLRADAALKLALAGKSQPGNPWIAGDVAAFVEVRGTEEKDLGFTGALGVTADRSRYNISEGDYFTTSVVYFHISGLISFPMANKHLALLAGIDLWVYANSSMSVLNTSRSGPAGTHSFSMDLDSNYDLVNSVQRKLVPGISTGLQYTPVLGRSVSIYAMVTQPLLSRLEEEVVLSYRLNGIPQTMTFNEQPTYLKLGMMFRLNY